jgi:hypothetical protein
MLDWNKAKWAALSRLPADNGESHLPFMDNPTEAATVTQQLSQEWKMLQRNASCQPSDTDAIASKDNCNASPDSWC